VTSHKDVCLLACPYEQRALSCILAARQLARDQKISTKLGWWGAGPTTPDSVYFLPSRTQLFSPFLTLLVRSILRNVCLVTVGKTDQFNKLTSVFYTSVLLLMINCVITLSKWLWNHEPQARGSRMVKCRE